jgi:hypothetical protein
MRRLKHKELVALPPQLPINRDQRRILLGWRHGLEMPLARNLPDERWVYSDGFPYWVKTALAHQRGRVRLAPIPDVTVSLFLQACLAQSVKPALAVGKLVW